MHSQGEYGLCLGLDLTAATAPGSQSPQFQSSLSTLVPLLFLEQNLFQHLIKCIAFLCLQSETKEAYPVPDHACSLSKVSLQCYTTVSPSSEAAPSVASLEDKAGVQFHCSLRFEEFHHYK